MTTGATIQAENSPTTGERPQAIQTHGERRKAPQRARKQAKKQSRKAGQAATIHSPMTGGKDYHRSMTGGKAAKPHRSMTDHHGTMISPTAPAKAQEIPQFFIAKPVFREQNVNKSVFDRVFTPVFGPKNPRIKIPKKGGGIL